MYQGYRTAGLLQHLHEGVHVLRLVKEFGPLMTVAHVADDPGRRPALVRVTEVPCVPEPLCVEVDVDPHIHSQGRIAGEAVIGSVGDVAEALRVEHRFFEWVVVAQLHD